MKNFPNQVSNPEKFRAALGVIEAVREVHGDPADDGVLGAALAREGVYTWRGGTVTERIAAEALKPASKQGMRTAAREMRRTLRALGLIDGSWRLTPMGQALRAAPPDSEQERAIWRRALVSLELGGGDGGPVSHPVLVLLRLVDARQIRYRDGTELALEARDDSAVELKRMLKLIDLPSEERLAAMGITKTQQDNGRKIFPALAEHAGLIERTKRSEPYVLTELGRNALEEAIGGATAPPPAPKTSSRSRRAGFRGAPRLLGKGGRRRGRKRPSPAPRSQPTPEGQAAADQRLFERTERHEDLVDHVLERLPPDSKSWEDGQSYDLVTELGSGELLLFEMKTLELDEATQTRRAIGQLLFYEGVVVKRRWPDRPVERIVVYESTVPEYLPELLQEIEIGALYCDSEGLHPLNAIGKGVVERLAAT